MRTAAATAGRRREGRRLARRRSGSWRRRRSSRRRRAGELVSLLRDLLSEARAGDGPRPANVYPLGGAHDARADAPDQAR